MEKGQTPKSIEDYPLVLTASHVAEIMHVSRSTAYELMERKDFPAMQIGERGKRVGRDAFFRWFNAQSRGGVGVDLAPKPSVNPEEIAKEVARIFVKALAQELEEGASADHG